MRAIYLLFFLLITVPPAANATVYACGDCIDSVLGTCVGWCKCGAGQTGCVGTIVLNPGGQVGDAQIDTLKLSPPKN